MSSAVYRKQIQTCCKLHYNDLLDQDIKLTVIASSENSCVDFKHHNYDEIGTENEHQRIAVSFITDKIDIIVNSNIICEYIC